MTAQTKPELRQITPGDRRTIADDMNAAIIGNLARLMRERGVKAAPLARAAALNESGVRDIMRGRSQNAGAITLTLIATALRVDLSAVLATDAAESRLEALLSEVGEERRRQDAEGDAQADPIVTAALQSIASCASRADMIHACAILLGAIDMLDQTAESPEAVA